MYKERLYSILFEKFLHDKLETKTFLRLNEDVDIITELDAKKILQKINLEKKIKDTETLIDLHKRRYLGVASSSRIHNDKVLRDLLKRLKKFKSMKAALIAGGIAATGLAGYAMLKDN